MTQTPWPLQRMRPDLAWPISEGAGITVAVIDSGVSPNPPALAGKVLEGRDFVEPSKLGQCDEVAHGTVVAGVIAGRTPGGSVFTGIAPKAMILPIRVLPDLEKDFDPGRPNVIAEAIDYAASHGADVINLSLTTDPTPVLEQAINDALAQNIVLVAAAGNDGGGDGQNQKAYPAAYDGVIAVAGIDREGHHVATSTSGAYVDVAAPGAEVDGPMPRGDGYAQFTKGGTSFASAYVSGLAALIRSADPNLKPAEVAERIATTADHPPEGRNDLVGYGVINPYRAMTAITGAPKASPPAVALDPVALPADPMGNTRTLATWTAATLAVLALVIALCAAVVRGTRRRRLGDSPAVASVPRRPRAERTGPGDAKVTAPKVRNRGATKRPAGAPSPTATRPATAAGERHQPLSWQPGAQRTSPTQQAGSQATPNYSGRAQVPPY
ncbi:type VII secretion-associated serine protease mycosin [Asanoa hainanensis]|uniref:Type VII secretion-associated serine protease mycosin n=1 Tax=Asanoa hainanensis TaxID=560556 RepID=A0A239MSJ3_9ACTN|nr:type VII secretion-associated serine protease mycosin [Asanoa hainanensis]SNT45440.1 type VII secretion-associated serine protease mycosin [Asanoa hainanensis]